NWAQMAEWVGRGKRMGQMGCFARGGEEHARRECVNMKTSCLTYPKRARGPMGQCATVQIRDTGFGGRSGRLGFPPASAIASVITVRTLTKGAGVASRTCGRGPASVCNAQH